ncbi:MAG: hypothetical protein J6Z36_01645 [Clostridia bacterium]|nr:hypothetical protein [Clostridia bacterium]
MVTPVKRSHLVIGKVLALALVSLISALSSFLGLIFSLPSLMGVEFVALPYGVGEYAALLAMIVLTVLLFTVILTIISTYAKSVKEASGLSVPVMVLILVLSLASSIVPVSGMVGYCIPLFNVVLCVTSIVAMEFSLVGFLLTLAINTALIAAGVVALVKMFDSEKVIFNR